ncbi:hypothetical protein ACLBXM_12140 [Xanthobacteraceae bacterium A53D]
MIKSVRTVLGPAILAAAILLPAAAMALPEGPQMTCRQAASLVQARGAAVISTAPRVYDRYVASRAYCPQDQGNDPAWIATSDNPQCFVGYTCFDLTRDMR